MRWILRGLGILLLTASILLGVAWVVLAHTDVPARVITAAFNDDNRDLWLEARSARLHGDLLGVRVEGLSLAERSRKDPIVRLEHLDAALGALPSDDLISLDHVDVVGLRVALDQQQLPALQALVAEEAAPSEPGKPGALVRLGRLRLTDASFAWRGTEGPFEIPDLDLELSGVAGASTDLTLALAIDGVTSSAPNAPLTMGKASLEAAVKIEAATGSGEVRLGPLALASLEVKGWRLEQLAVERLVATGQGLGGTLSLGSLTVKRLEGPGFELVDATLALEASGGVAGVQLTRAALSSPRLSATLDGYAKPTFGLGGQGLEVVLQGTLEATPASLLPASCPGVRQASGRFRMVGDVTRGGLTLASLALTLITEAGPREVVRTDVSLADTARLHALAAELCAEASAGAP